jgi:hypothetical protein
MLTVAACSLPRLVKELPKRLTSMSTVSLAMAGRKPGGSRARALYDASRATSEGPRAVVEAGNAESELWDTSSVWQQGAISGAFCES